MKPLILRDPPCHSNTSCNKATNLIIATKRNAWETTIGLFLPTFDDHLQTGMWNGSLFEQSVSLGLAGGFGDGAPAHVRVIASELRL